MDSFLGRGYMPDMSTNSITELPFMKMHGLGNDFVVVDARANPVEITPAMARGIAHRQFGVGFDQLAVIEQGHTIQNPQTNSKTNLPNHRKIIISEPQPSISLNP